MHSVCHCSLPVWRRSFLKKGTPWPILAPPWIPPLGGSGRKTTTLVRDHDYFIPTKFHQNLSSGSWEEVENVKSLRTDGRTDDRRCAMTIAHSSLRLRWAKNLSHLRAKNGKSPQIFLSIFTSRQLKLSLNVLIRSTYLSIMETTRWDLSNDM